MEEEQNINELEQEETDEAKAVKKAARIAKSRAKLLENLDAGNFKQLQTKVAHILNIYPDTRNSDITLALKYWETYQYNVFDGEYIGKRDLFKLERQVDITRARAKIQNEYKLFMAKDEIRHHRKKNEKEMVDTMRSQTVSPIKKLHVFSDESGKNQDYFVVGSVWVLQANQLAILAQKIDTWKTENGYKGKEIHFKKIKKNDVDRIKNFINLIADNSSYLGFKFITVKNSEVNRSPSETLAKLIEIMLHKGIEHETTTKRVSANTVVKVNLDNESSLDALALQDLEHNVKTKLTSSNLTSELESITTIKSHLSNFIQIADLIASAIGRKLNNPDSSGDKDVVADYLINQLSLNLDNESDIADMAVRFDVKK
jgi:hypothetical protein